MFFSLKIYNKKKEIGFYPDPYLEYVYVEAYNEVKVNYAKWDLHKNSVGQVRGDVCWQLKESSK